MANVQSEALVREIRQCYQQLLRPFPYEDCQMLRSQDEDRFDWLIPDLAQYLSTVAGYGSWGGRVLGWDEEQANLAREDLSKSFFETYTEYTDLRDQITEATTPSLSAELAVHDHVRELLLELIAALPAQRADRFSLQEVA